MMATPVTFLRSRPSSAERTWRGALLRARDRTRPGRMVRSTRRVGSSGPRVLRDRRLAHERARSQQMVGPEAHRRVRAGARAASPRHAPRRHVRGRYEQDGLGARHAALRRIRHRRSTRGVAHGRDDVPADTEARSLGALRLGGRLDPGERDLRRQGPVQIGRCGGACRADRCRVGRGDERPGGKERLAQLRSFIEA